VKWIWEEARLNLADSMGVLDIDHALEAVGDTSKNLFGDGTPEANAWTNLLRTTILERGWEVFDGFWQQTRSPFSETSPPATAPNELRNYLGNQVSQMNCAERLKDVLSIGSGQIEGAWKNLITRRLNRIEGLCSIMYSKQLRFIQGFGGLSYIHLCECYPISENLVWWRVSSRCLRCS